LRLIPDRGDEVCEPLALDLHMVLNVPFGRLAVPIKDRLDDQPVLFERSCGAVAGMLAGLIGIGGGVIIVPIVTLLFEGHGIAQGLAIKLALGTSLATIW
jgi:uncharacterized membrane protein YfcA